MLVNNLGPWFGGLQWRALGAYPISDGDKDPQDKGYSEVNLDIGYKFNDHLKIQATIFNLLNTKGNAGGLLLRLPPARRASPAGVNDFQNHPLEPISGAGEGDLIF